VGLLAVSLLRNEYGQVVYTYMCWPDGGGALRLERLPQPEWTVTVTVYFVSIYQMAPPEHTSD